MRPLTAEDEATLRAIAERHGFYAARGPHTGEGSASRLVLDGECVGHLVEDRSPRGAPPWGRRAGRPRHATHGSPIRSRSRSRPHPRRV